MMRVRRCLALFFLSSVMIVAVAGCAAHRPEGAAQPKRLAGIRTTVPKLAGLSLDRAQTVLSFVGLKVGEVTLSDTDDASLHGQVFGQDPAPGTGVRGGRAVNVKVYRFVGRPEEGRSPEAGSPARE